MAKLKDGKCWMTQNLKYSNNSSYITPEPDSNHFGAYYTWNNAQTICPSGWSLPSGTVFENMNIYYTELSFQQAPANFVLSGYWNNNNDYKVTGTNYHGAYWTTVRVTWYLLGGSYNKLETKGDYVSGCVRCIKM